MRSSIILTFSFLSVLFAQTQLGDDIDGEAASDQSGYSISINSDGDRVAIGANKNDGTGTDMGHVRVYSYSNGSWSQMGSDIDGEANSDRSGNAVSLDSDGDRVAIGGYFNDGNGTNAGHVRVYEYSSGSWTQLGSDIDGEAAGDEFGSSVSLNSDGTIVAIGAHYNDGTGTSAGHVRVYEYSSGSWTQLGSDIDGEAANDWSGHSEDGSAVSLNSDGTIVAIGANFNDGNGTNAGHVRVYEYSSGSWSKLGSDIDGEAAGDNFGISVSLDSDGDRVAIGGYYNNGTGTQAGHVRVYAYSSGSWSQLGSDIDGEAAGDLFGFSVSLDSDGDRVVIGADSNAGTALAAGHARVYAYSSGSWSQLGSDIDGEAQEDSFGRSVSMDSDGDRVAVAAFRNDGTASNAGHVRIYTYDTTAPTVSSVTSTTANGSYNVDDVIAVTVTFNEAVTVTGTPQLTLETGSTDAVVNYSSGSRGTTLTFNYTVASGHVSSDLDYKATNSLALNSGTIRDEAGNNATLTLASPGATNSLGANKAIVIDTAVPTVSSTSVTCCVITNSLPAASLVVTFSEAVYRNSNGSGTVEESDIALSISGGIATFRSDSIGAISINGAGNIYTYDIKLDKLPNGSEVITVRPEDDGIYDAAGNEASTSQSNNTATLPDKVVPTMTITATDGSNAVSDGATTNDATLTVTFTSSEATSNFVVGDITVSGGALSSFSATSSTVYTATFTPSANGATTIDVAANKFTDASSNNNTAASQFNWTYDGTVPTISSVSLASDNSTIAVTMSEAVYNTNGGSGALETTDFQLIISGGLATLSSATPSSISISGNVYTLGIPLTGYPPNGSEALYVFPVDNGIYDAVGNEASTTQSNNTVTLNDKLFPYLTAASLAADNSYIDATYSEGLYSTNGGSGAIDTSDTTPIFVQNNGNATNAIFTSFKQQDNTSESSASALAAGATTVRAFLRITGIPSGVETISWKSRDNASVFDALGNAEPATAAATPLVLNDQLGPTMTITATDGSNAVSDGSTTNDGTLTVTFTSSEATSNFAAADITVSGGAISNFSATSSTVYTATFTPSANGATTIDVAANKFTDAASNNNTAASQFNWTYDNTASTMTITATNGSSAVSDGATTNDATLTVTFTSSKATTNFVVGDITVSGGALSSFSATSSTVYTATFTPSANGATTIDVAENGFTDAVGNNNSAATQFNWTYDGTAPTMTITASDGSDAVSDGATTNDATLTVSFTSSEATTNFVVGDITVSGGALSSFSAFSSLMYDVTFTPSASGATTIDVAANVFTDAAGNNNTAVTQFNWTYDGTAPATPTGLVATPGNNQVTLTWTANSESDLASYKVYGGTSASPTTLLSTISSGTETYTHTSLTNSTNYYYRISAADNVGNESSKTSDANARLNASPVLSSIESQTVNEDKSLTITLSATDVDGDDITYSTKSDTSAVAALVSSSTLTLTPNANWNGTATITAYASDGTLKDSTTFTLTVTPVNDAPVITAVPNDSTNEETEKSIVLSASDIDGDALTYSASSDTSAVAVTVSTNTLKLTPALNYTGTSVITAIVSDNALADTTKFDFKVINVNDAPVIAAVANDTTSEDSDGMVLKLSASDIDGDALTYSAVSDTLGLTVTVSNDTVRLKPVADYFGTSNVTAVTNDGTIKDSTTFSFTVLNVQDAPYAFDWVSTASDTIDISQSNLADTYELKWLESKDVDGETIGYLLYVKIGVNPPELIYDTTSTSVPITYQEFADNVFEPFPMLPRVTIQFSMEATDGIDTVKITGDNRVLFINRYAYLSTVSEGIPTEFALHENYPNPFNPTTTLRFDLPELSDMTLIVYNMLGQKVKTFNMQSTPAGYHSVTWDATNDLGQQVGAGVYLYQLQTKDFVKTRKMVLLK